MRRFHSKENFHFTAMASAGAKISPRKKLAPRWKPPQRL